MQPASTRTPLSHTHSHRALCGVSGRTGRHRRPSAFTCTGADQATPAREECQGAHVLWGASGESDSKVIQDEMLSSEVYQVTYRALVPRWRTGNQAVLSIPHANLHSCLRKVGFCTPFVANTRTLSTHSPARARRNALHLARVREMPSHRHLTLRACLVCHLCSDR